MGPVHKTPARKLSVRMQTKVKAALRSCVDISARSHAFSHPSRVVASAVLKQYERPRGQYTQISEIN